jgi:hypothetical protein
MKRRQSFVTNSSSTSFIIAYRKENDLKIKLMIEVDLSTHISDEFKTEEDILDFVESDDISDNTKELLLDGIKKGNTISRISFHSDGDPIDYLLYEECEQDDNKFREMLGNSKIKVLDIEYN